MRWPAGPITVAPGTFTIPLPAGSNQALLAGVLINNNSQYLLSVGPSRDWLQPFSTGWFGQDALNAAQLSVNALAVGSQTSAADGQILTAMFYGVDEQPPVVTPFAADPITVAEALALSGIPNVLDTVALYRGSQANPLAPQAAQDLPSVGGYASLTILTQEVTLGPNAPTNLQLDWYQTDATGAATGLPYTEYLTTVLGGAAQGGAWSVPVAAGFLRITNARAIGGHGLAVQVYGSNRAVPRPTQLGNSYLTRQFRATVTTTGPFVTLPPVDGGPACTNLTGQCYVRASASGASGFFAGLQWLTPNNTVVQTYFTPTRPAGGDFEGFIAHPLGVVQPVMLPVAPLGVTSYLLEITQA